MSQLLSGRHRGRFGAPPEKGSPWWATAPVYGLLVLSTLGLVVTGAVFLAYAGCSDGGTAACQSTRLLQSSTGSYTGILAVSGTALGAGLASGLVARVVLGRRHFLVSWGLAAVSLGCVALAFAVLSGLSPTPWGELLPDTAQ